LGGESEIREGEGGKRKRVRLIEGRCKTSFQGRAEEGGKGCLKNENKKEKRGPT